MRVLLVASELPPVISGVARSVDRLRVGLEERGHQVDAMSGTRDGVWVVGEYRIPRAGGRFVRRFDSLRDYDVIALHGPAPFLSDLALARWAVARRRPALVYTHHFTVWIDGLGRLCTLYDRVHRHIARAATRTVVTTPTYRRRLRAAGVHDPVVIPWSGELDTGGGAVERPTEGPLRVLFVGQMRPYKGVDVLIRAVAGVPGVAATIMGGGPLLEQYRGLAAGLGADNISLPGRVPDPDLVEAYRSHHVLVLPSINPLEAFGIVLVEGMGAGCVPVVSDVEGLGDVVGSAGTVVARRDPESLRAALVRLGESRADPGGLESRSERARLRAGEFSWERTVDHYEAVLQDAMEERS